MFAVKGSCVRVMWADATLQDGLSSSMHEIGQAATLSPVIPALNILRGDTQLFIVAQG
jgi:hypothetical protein